MRRFSYGRHLREHLTDGSAFTGEALGVALSDVLANLPVADFQIILHRLRSGGIFQERFLLGLLESFRDGEVIAARPGPLVRDLIPPEQRLVLCACAMLAILYALHRGRYKITHQDHLG